MPTEDTQSQSYGQWVTLQSQPPLYVYPGSQPPEEGQSLQTPVSASHDTSPDVPSYNYGPSYNQISRTSSLLPSSSQYSHTETAQLQHPSYSTPSYSDTHQPRHDYFPASQNSFDSAAVSTITSPPYGTPNVPGTYSSSHFPPHQFPELRPAHNYSAGSSLPTPSSLDTLAPAISTFDAPHIHTPTSAVSNKRQRSEDQDQDEGDNAQGRGDTAMSLAEKLKRACARCRGLKVGQSLSVLNRPESNISARSDATLGMTRIHATDVSKRPRSALFRAGSRGDLPRTLPSPSTMLQASLSALSALSPFSKRELLLAKIRDQATQIKELMAQLETIQTTDKNVTQLTIGLPTEFARSSSLESPRSGTFIESSGYAVDVLSTQDYASSVSAADSKISQESSEWIAKARENLEAFGDFIRLGGSSTARRDLVDQDLEDSSSSDDGYRVTKDSSGSEDELDVDHLSPERPGTVRERGLAGKGSPSGRAKMVGLPAQASPFGMMATLSVKNIKPKKSGSVVSDMSDLGVANEDFFRTRRYYQRTWHASLMIWLSYGSRPLAAWHSRTPDTSSPKEGYHYPRGSRKIIQDVFISFDTVSEPF
jgi:hypothetical protein